MIDPHLAAAVQTVTHGHIHQVEDVRILMSGNFDAVTTVGEALDQCVVGLGVAAACDGEIITLDRSTWRIPATGVPEQIGSAFPLAFAIGAEGGTPLEIDLDGNLGFDDIVSQIDEVLPSDLVAAVRIDGDFEHVLLRSEPRQQPPFRTLTEVLADEVHFSFEQWTGTLAGFRFPDRSTPDVIPALHLHALSADHRSGGHCHHAHLLRGTLRLWLDDVTIEMNQTSG
jgi:acetolactate decarboxylase